MNLLVEANTAFGLELYGQVRSTHGNLALSPYSISAALAMARAGARGDTARQMDQTLHFGPCQPRLQPLFGQLNAALNAVQAGNELCIAHSLWPQVNDPFRPEFLDLLKQYYQATVTPVNFQAETDAARNSINQWVDDKTKHKITDFVGPDVLSTLTRMVLVNAIYFKGMWAIPFRESATQPAKFYTQPDTILTVPFMHHSAQFGYGEDEHLQVLALPYLGLDLDMLVLLPRARDGIRSLESSLTPAKLATWMSLSSEEVDVALPKFTLSSHLSLAAPLQAMGLKDAFDPDRADFSGMDGRPHWLCLSAVLHRAQVEVNEVGTEAAAAGLAETYWCKVPEFRADHPFLFLIRDRRTGSILFIGRVLQPGASADVEQARPGALGAGYRWLLHQLRPDHPGRC
jgi:serine protease inhibitor